MNRQLQDVRLYSFRRRYRMNITELKEKVEELGVKPDRKKKLISYGLFRKLKAMNRVSAKTMTATVSIPIAVSGLTVLSMMR